LPLKPERVIVDVTGSKLNVAPAPGVLTWARETIGLPLEVAAKRLGIKPETLAAIEEGTRPVTLAKIRLMAKQYDRPLIAFFLPAPPREEELPPDFRVIREGESRAWSPALTRAFRRAVGQREVMLSLTSTDDSDERIPEVSLALDVRSDSEDAARRVRAWLTPPALHSNNPYDHLNAWISQVEERGILVTQISDVPIEEARGFSIGQYPLPVIAINGAEPPRGRLFTLMHELVHVLLHRGALCDLEDSRPSVGAEGRRLEWYCNSVAAAVLMPRSAVMEAVGDRGQDTNWTDDELRRLSEGFGVSAEAMLVRLVTLDLATRDYYRQRRPVFLAQYRAQRSAGGGFLPYYNKQIRNLSRRYIGVVWRAYERGEVSDPDLSTYLNTKPQNIPTLIAKAGIA
jgi:Zn-dependent peptidase ImmA (M78 family)/transcriptional regulator with XRE-family HTH domain